MGDLNDEVQNTALCDSTQQKNVSVITDGLVERLAVDANATIVDNESPTKYQYPSETSIPLIQFIVSSPGDVQPPVVVGAEGSLVSTTATFVLSVTYTVFLTTWRSNGSFITLTSFGSQLPAKVGLVGSEISTITRLSDVLPNIYAYLPET